MVKLYKEDKQYFWEIDRYKFFTQSEKSSLLAGLNLLKIRWYTIPSAHDKGGMIEMLDNLIKEVDNSLEDEFE